MIKNLRYLREKRGLSQSEFAAAVGISQQSVYKYENQTTEPDIAVLKKIALFFNTSVDFLIGNTDIERKYETVYKCELNEDEMFMMEKYRGTGEEGQKAILSLLDALSKEQP